MYRHKLSSIFIEQLFFVYPPPTTLLSQPTLPQFFLQPFFNNFGAKNERGKVQDLHSSSPVMILQPPPPLFLKLLKKGAEEKVGGRGCLRKKCGVLGGVERKHITSVTIFSGPPPHELFLQSPPHLQSSFGGIANIL